jgi:hypothetical protein
MDTKYRSLGSLALFLTLTLTIIFTIPNYLSSLLAKYFITVIFRGFIHATPLSSMPHHQPSISLSSLTNNTSSYLLHCLGTQISHEKWYPHLNQRYSLLLAGGSSSTESPSLQHGTHLCQSLSDSMIGCRGFYRLFL